MCYNNFTSCKIWGAAHWKIGKFMKRKFFSAMMGIVLAAVLIPVTASQAAAYNCSAGYSSVGAWAKCLSNEHSSDRYRVAVLCANRFTQSSRFAYGPWRSISDNSPSTATCEWYEKFVGNPRATNGI